MVFMSSTEQTEHFMYDDKVEVCSTPINTVLRKAYVIGTIVLFFVIPCGILVILYALICRQLLHDSLNPGSESSGMIRSVHAARSLQTRRQIIYMLITINILFFVCLLPIRVFTLWVIFTDNSDQDKLGLEGALNLVSFARVMFYLNSAGNPILYNIMSTKFREACRRALGCCCKGTASSQHGSTRIWIHHSQNGRTNHSQTEMELLHVKEGKVMVTFSSSKGATSQLISDAERSPGSNDV
jgi:hypothetical protein